MSFWLLIDAVIHAIEDVALGMTRGPDGEVEFSARAKTSAPRRGFVADYVEDMVERDALAGELGRLANRGKIGYSESEGGER